MIDPHFTDGVYDPRHQYSDKDEYGASINPLDSLASGNWKIDEVLATGERTPIFASPDADCEPIIFNTYRLKPPITSFIPERPKHLRDYRISWDVISVKYPTAGEEMRNRLYTFILNEDPRYPERYRETRYYIHIRFYPLEPEKEELMPKKQRFIYWDDDQEQGVEVREEDIEEPITKYLPTNIIRELTILPFTQETSSKS